MEDENTGPSAKKKTRVKKDSGDDDDLIQLGNGS